MRLEWDEQRQAWIEVRKGDTGIRWFNRPYGEGKGSMAGKDWDEYWDKMVTRVEGPEGQGWDVVIGVGLGIALVAVMYMVAQILRFVI